jgi:formylglycine-generating enzyme required for sulfatase activity
LVTGAQGDIVLTSLIPLRSRVVPPGFLMIRVEVAGFGSGEYLRDVARGEHLRLPVNIRSDAEVRSASEWCEVPRGTYRVGQPGANSASLYGEIALRSVGFMIEKFEVQCLHYKQYLIAVKDARRPAAWGDTLQNYRASMDRLPIHGISWLEAQRCAEWRGLRLPTWWEWQLAIRGSQGWFAPWGDEPGDIADKASVCRKPEDGPLHVGSRDGDKSLFGVMDGFGNVREWTALPFLTEIEGRVYPASGSRVTCGYEWFTSNSILSPWLGVTAVREGKPEHPNVGFRCVKVFATDARVVK